MEGGVGRDGLDHKILARVTMAIRIDERAVLPIFCGFKINKNNGDKKDKRD
jgi:hypothetical protein